MAQATFLKCECEHCGGHIEFPDGSANNIVSCPHCELPTRLIPPGPPGRTLPFDIWIPARTTAKTEGTTPPPEEVVLPEAQISTKGEWVGWGALIQLVGLALAFWFPIGTTVGVLLFFIGFSLSRKPVCSACRNFLDNYKVRACPACHASLVPMPGHALGLAWSAGALAVVLIGLVWFGYFYRGLSEQAQQASVTIRALQVLNYRVSPNDFGSWFIEGTLTNHSPSTFGDVRVDFRLYDPREVQVGLISAYKDKLLPHESWKFLTEAVVTNLAQVKVSGVSAKFAKGDFRSSSVAPPTQIAHELR